MEYAATLTQFVATVAFLAVGVAVAVGFALTAYLIVREALGATR